MPATFRRVLCLVLVALGAVGADVAPAPPEAVPQAEATPAVVTPRQHPLGPSFATGGKIAIIPVKGTIYGFTKESLERRVSRALAEGATLIVVEIDTTGGVLTAGLDISKFIKTIPAPTIAWIHPQAYSAGILIASAANAIIMSPASATGDCAPVSMLANLAPHERAKALSPLLEEFRDSARVNDYDYAMFHAMCELGVKLYLVEHIETAERRLVNELDYQVMVNGRDPNDTSWFSQVMQLAQSGGGSGEAVVSREVSTDADVRMWKPVTVLSSGAPLPGGLFHDGRTLLTMNQDRARDAGLSKETVRTEADLQQLLGATSVTRYPHTWAQTAASWAAHPAVKAVLIIALMVGTYIELQSPGLGAGGVVAVIALLGLVVAPYLVGLVEIWHIIALFLGFILLMIEIFVTPGFGVLGISGILLMCAGLIFIGVPTAAGGGIGGMLPAPEMMGWLQASAISLVLAFIVSGVAFFFLSKHFGTLPVLGRLILRDPATAAAIEADESEQTPTRPPGSDTDVSGDEAIGNGAVRVGDAGVVTTGLRPTGRASFAGRIVDVTSVGSWVDQGRRVRIIEVRGNRIVVEPVV